MLTTMTDPKTGDFPLKQYLDMEIRTLEPGHTTAEITIDERHLNPNGVAHGSVIFAMIDTAMGGAAISLIPQGKVCTTTDIHLRFMRAVSSGRIVADTTVVKPGRTLMNLESRVHDDNGRLVASATGAFMVIDQPGSESTGLLSRA